MEPLHDKTLVMIIGPSAVGKSTLMNEIITRDHEFGRVGGFTTRNPRPNDEPGQYRYYTKQQVAEKIQSGALVQYAEFPTTGQIYGTEPQDYTAKYNVKDVLVNSVDTFRTLPFKQTIAISITANASYWEQWFMARYKTITDDARKRLEEAKISVEWSLRQTADHNWIVNQSDNIAYGANAAIAISRGELSRDDTPSEARKMLETINRLLSYE